MFVNIHHHMLSIFINDTDRNSTSIWSTYVKDYLNNRCSDGRTYHDSYIFMTSEEFKNFDITNSLKEKEWRSINFIMVESGDTITNEALTEINNKVSEFKPLINPHKPMAGAWSGHVTIVNFVKFTMKEVTLTQGSVTNINNWY